MSIRAEIRPSRARGMFVAGAVLVVVALVGITAYALGLPDQLPVEASAVGLVRGATIVAAAIAGGAGALLIALGVVKRRSAAVRGLPEG